MFKRKRKILESLLFILILLLTFNCKKNQTADSEKEAEEESIFAVHTTTAISGELKDYIELNGDVKAKVEVDIYPDVAGKLVKIYSNLGDNVEKNQVVAEIDPSKPGMNFTLSPVKSTISGTVTSLPVKTGSTVSQQTTIVKVGKLDELEIVTYIAEKFIRDININQPVIITTQAYPDTIIEGLISEVSPVVDPQTRMLELKIKINKNQQLLKPGMFAELRIIINEKKNIIKAQSECVIKKFDKYYVFIVKRSGNDDSKGTVEQREIIPGIQIDNKLEIIKGVENGEEVVIRGQSLLVDQSKINIIKTVEPLPVLDELL